MYGSEVLRVPAFIPPLCRKQMSVIEIHDRFIKLWKIHIKICSPAAMPEGNLCCYIIGRMLSKNEEPKEYKNCFDEIQNNNVIHSGNVLPCSVFC